jgi:hypothetical protein
MLPIRSAFYESLDAGIFDKLAGNLDNMPTDILNTLGRWLGGPF